MHPINLVESCGGLEAAMRLVKRLRALPTREEMNQMLAILQMGMTAAQGAW